MRKGSIDRGLLAGIFGLSLVLGAGRRWRDRPTSRNTAARSRSARSTRRSRRCRGTRTTGTGSSTTTPASSTSSCSPPTSPRACATAASIRFYRRCLAALRRHPRRAGRELGVEGEPAARRDQAAQGHHVPGQAGRDEGARARRRRRRLQLQPPRQQPEEAHRLLRPRRQSRGHRQAHGRLHLQGLQRRVGLPLRLGLLLGDHAQGGGRRRRQQLEERQRHRPVHADRLRAGQLQHLRQEPDLLGQGEDRRRRIQAARSSTSSSTAPSRTRRPASPRCAPARSTSSRRSAGRTSSS